MYTLSWPVISNLELGGEKVKLDGLCYTHPHTNRCSETQTLMLRIKHTSAQIPTLQFMHAHLHTSPDTEVLPPTAVRLLCYRCSEKTPITSNALSHNSNQPTYLASFRPTHSHTHLSGDDAPPSSSHWGWCVCHSGVAHRYRTLDKT